MLAAARNFLREEFGLLHRYAFVLHTDTPRPHVHAVVKAVSEQGIRLHITKPMLRRWRQEFARNLRDQGIEANATERAVRGNSHGAKKDGIYRAARRGVSTYVRDQTESVARELLKEHFPLEKGKAKLIQTRRRIEQGARAISNRLVTQGHPDLAADLASYVEKMPPPQSDRERIAQQIRDQVRREHIVERSPQR